MREEADRLLDFVGLKGFEDRGSTTLAYGNQRRLEIARALATQPSLLLLDEPAAGMNEAESETLVALIRKVRDTGVTVLLIEHHMSVVMTVSDRVLVMQNGAVLAEGTPQEIQSNTKVIAAYLGEDLL
jgi:branched-chain amino acid transport system ATP-binding protein